MKLALALLLLAAPLYAQTPANQKIVVKVVVTLVKGSALTPTPTPVLPPAVTPMPTVPIATPVTNPTPTPVTSAPGSTGCNNYPDAVTNMGNIAASLVQAQQLYDQALATKAITAAVYATGSKTLSVVRLDNADIRDLIRIDGPSSIIQQNITFVSAEIGTLPGLLGSTTPLRQSLTTLTSSMQSSLGTVKSDIAQSTCAQPVP